MRTFGSLNPQITGQKFTDLVLAKLAEDDPDWVFVEVSGGVDSTAMLWAVANSDEIDVDAVVHLNTGIGAEFTREYVRKQAAELGLPYIEGIQPKWERRYATRFIKHGAPGPRPQAHNIHRIDGKQDVEDKLVQSFNGDIVILTGVSRHESNRRKKTVSQSGIQADKRHDWVTYGGPVAEYTGSELRQVLHDNDVEVNELADVMDSSAECLCGSFDTFWILGVLWKYHPEIVIGLWALMSMASRYWVEYREKNGEPPYPRQFLIWGHGGLGEGVLSEMVVGELDDPSDFYDSEREKRAKRHNQDSDQFDLANKCASCKFPEVGI